jgi:hypothetical protein
MSKADMKSFKINWGNFQLNTKDSEKIKYKNVKFSFAATKKYRLIWYTCNKWLKLYPKYVRYCSLGSEDMESGF